MKKRRLAALAAAAMMALSMTACSSGSTATAAATTQAAAETKAETAAETKAAETAAAESKAAASEKKTSGAVKELPARADDVLLMATTTSTDNTGLLDYLQPIFKEDTGIDLKWVAVGTGDAIKKAEDGEVDVILVHAKKKEEAFVESGYGVSTVFGIYIQMQRPRTVLLAFTLIKRGAAHLLQHGSVRGFATCWNKFGIAVIPLVQFAFQALVRLPFGAGDVNCVVCLVCHNLKNLCD